MYQCISVAHINPESLNEILQAAKIIAKETRMQEGNLSYNVIKPENRDDIVIITERWENKSNFEAHVAHASEEGDLVFEFGKVMDKASTSPAELYPSEVLL